MIRFEVGKTYATRRMGDHTMFVTRTVIARTAKFLTVVDPVYGDHLPERIGVRRYDWGDVETETCRPEGTHSMCPVLFASTDEVKEN